MATVRGARQRRSWRTALTTARDRYVRLAAEGPALERTTTFTDAVFAIAMTLLVLELRVPEVQPAQLPAALLGLVPPYLTFALSFTVVGLIWLSHHRKFKMIVRYTQTLLRLNLLMLLLVASLALPTAVLGRYGDQVIAVVVYAGFASAVGLLMSMIWLYAWRRQLVDERVDRAVFRYVLGESLPIPMIFLLSIPIAVLAGAHAGEYTWILAFPVLFALRHLTAGPGRRGTP